MKHNPNIIHRFSTRLALNAPILLAALIWNTPCESAQASIAQRSHHTHATKPQRQPHSLPGKSARWKPLPTLAVQAFAAEMHEQYGFDASKLAAQFKTLRQNESVLQLIRPAGPNTKRSWAVYQSRFVNEQRIREGVTFWNRHSTALAKAESQYGVPAEIIVGILGVETIYGRQQGEFLVMEALATLAFSYPPRAGFFRDELVALLRECHEQNIDPTTLKGSFAGALGMSQFMPSNWRTLAVDFDEDGKVDLKYSAEDAIGSVAHFLAQHGWARGHAIADRWLGQPTLPKEWIDTGLLPSLTLADLAKANIATPSTLSPSEKFAMIELVSPNTDSEYWLGFQNFYVITRYNRSSFYAMSVFQLAEAIRAERAKN